jgi:hypothetical protein
VRSWGGKRKRGKRKGTQVLENISVCGRKEGRGEIGKDKLAHGRMCLSIAMDRQPRRKISSECVTEENMSM